MKVEIMLILVSPRQNELSVTRKVSIMEVLRFKEVKMIELLVFLRDNDVFVK